MLFFWYFYLSNNPQLLFFILTDFNNKDWSNDAENSALHHKNTLHCKIYSNRKQLF